MTRSEIASIACSVAACVGMFFAVSQSRRSSASLLALEEKFAKLESALIATPKSPAADAQFAREIAALRADVSSLASRVASASALGNANSPADPTPTVIVSADEKRRLEEAEARQKEWLRSLTQNIVNALVQKLELTKQQESGVRPLVEKLISDYREERKAGNSSDAKKAIDALVQDSNEKIKVLLTPEQQSKYDELAKGHNGIFNLGSMVLTPRTPGAIEGMGISK